MLLKESLNLERGLGGGRGGKGRDRHYVTPMNPHGSGTVYARSSATSRELPFQTLGRRRSGNGKPRKVLISGDRDEFHSRKTRKRKKKTSSIKGSDSIKRKEKLFLEKSLPGMTLTISYKSNEREEGLTAIRDRRQ